MGTKKLNDQRRMWKFIVFGILSFGIYDIYVQWTMVNDINVACGYKERGDDSSRSPHFLIMLLLSLVTLGIYTWVWYYKQGNRLKNVGEEYGVKIDEKGSTYILWMLLGGLVLGIGTLVGFYFFLCNVNKVCAAYNAEVIYKSGGERAEIPSGPSSQPEWVNGPIPDEPSGVTVPIPRKGTLNFIAGEYKGARISLNSDEDILLGRNQEICQLVFSEKDISRKHCKIRYSGRSGHYYVTDYSSLGTVMNDSVRLRNGEETKCSVGTKLTLGSGKNILILQ